MRTLSPMFLMMLAAACGRDTIAFDATEDNDGDGFTVLEDCNDLDDAVFPGAEELCNGIDDDCDGTTDGNNATDAAYYYVDLDGDGEAGTPTPLRYCAAPDNAVAEATDCDDVNASIFPGAPEVCNDRDDDCDGLVDTDDDSLVTGSARVFYEDADGDGHASSTSASVEACSTPDGYALLVDDCDDGNAAVFPGATEVCNGIDDDCNDVMDDADPRLDLTSTTVFYIDRDADGFGGAFFPVRACEQPAGTTTDATDCDDVDARIFPGATEVCDGRDNDCDGMMDDADDGLDATTASAWFADTDEDGFGDATASAVMACLAPAGAVANNTDCVDSDASISPSAVEVCNEVDDDCDSRIDDVDPTLDAASATRWWSDRDGDGVGGTFFSIVSCEQPDGMVEASGDCRDDDATISPERPEVCNGIDDDCNRLVDDDDGDLDLTTASPWYADADGDGWGTDGEPLMACIAPDGFGTDQSDCDDTDPAIGPQAAEVCNGIDDNCNGQVDDQDDGLTADGASYFYDNDGDGFGTTDTWACMDFGFGWTEEVGDCNDNDGTTYPNADELCDFRDNDCDGITDEDPTNGSSYYADVDRDGFGAGPAIIACRQESGVVSRDGDCDDTTNQVNPDRNEVCDGRDNDCDGIVDTDTPNLPVWYTDGDLDGFGADGSGVAACSTFDGRVNIDGDCDDTDPLVGPGVDETDDDGIDNDCDGNVDIPDPLVGGLITEDATWGTGAPGSYELDFNALVDVGVTLTIEPCTRILMAPDATLQIEGTLIARGTEECPIVFTSAAADPAPGDWARLYFTASHTPGSVDDNTGADVGSALEYVEVLYGGGQGAGIVIEGAGAPHFRNVRVAFNQSAGVDVIANRMVVQSSLFEYNQGTGLRATSGNGDKLVDVFDSTFIGNTGGGAAIGRGCCYGQGTAIRGNRFIDNQGDALRLNGGSPLPYDISDNDFIRNTGAAISGNPVVIADIERNRMIGNRFGVYGGYNGRMTYQGNVFAGQTDLALKIRYGASHDVQGNVFVRNARIHNADERWDSSSTTFVDNLFQESPGDAEWVKFQTLQQATVASSMVGNNFVSREGLTGGSFLNVGYVAGSGRVQLGANYWNGVNPNAEADAIIDFIDDASLAVADPSGFLSTPNPAAPISVPAGVQAESDGTVVTLSWDAVPDTDVAGYRVYYGQQTDAWLLDGTGAAEGDSGFTVASTGATLSGLDLTQPWRIAITAVDTDASGTSDDLYAGHESWYSVVVEP